MLAIASKRALSVGLITLTTFAMLFAALAAMAPFAAGTPATAGPAAVCGQVPVPLSSASSYAVLASTTVTSTGPSHLTGDLGLWPGTSVTGFPPATITGDKNVTTPPAKWAVANLTVAYNNASGRTNCPVAVAGNIGGQTLTPGLYKSTSSLAISSGDLTLSGGGNPHGVFIFQVASTLTTTSGRTVILSNGAQASNVFWEIGSSATLGTTSVMQGTVMAHDSISMLSGSTLDGRALVQTGEVSLQDTTITVPTTTSMSTYPVTFTESGLPAATSWSVTFGGVQGSSTTTTIGFTAVSGTYPFAINLAGYIATPASGKVTVNGAAAGKSISFTAGAAGTYNITFTESGLTSGTSWSVTCNGVLNTSTTTTIGFTVLSGTYAYTVGVVGNYTAGPTAGSVTVNGAATGQAISFTAGLAGTYGVTFTESGLASGTSWSVTFGGVLNTSTTTTIGFAVVNGVYTFTVSGVSNYSVSLASGVVTVNGSATGQAISFTSTGGGGGGGGGSSGTYAGIPTWGWVVIGVVVVGAVAGTAIALSRRGKTKTT
jgi:type VI secretion system secreted protein VgrG